MDEAASPSLQLTGISGGLLDIPTAREPVRLRDADPEDYRIQHLVPHHLECGERKRHAGLQRTAPSTLSCVAERKEKLMQQISVGTVNFNQIEAQLNGPTRRTPSPALRIRAFKHSFRIRTATLQYRPFHSGNQGTLSEPSVT